MDIYKKIKGRGTRQNQSSRFHEEKLIPDYSDAGWVEEEDLPKVRTEFFTDRSKSILSQNKSPDIFFNYSINPYRGCEHGCSYCYARPTHEYLGMSAGLDFESKIFVKKEAAELLRKQLMSKSWKPEIIVISGNTDCYQPAERKFKITRSLLEVLNEFKNPVGLITKNQLICRDLDLLSEMAKENRVNVCLSITTLDADLARKLEPRTSTPQARLNAVENLSKAGIPVSVNMAPVIPGLTDHEIPSVLKAASEAGALAAGYTPLRLPHSVKDLFTEWLESHYPNRKMKVLRAIEDIRDGRLNDSDFGQRMKGTGQRAESMAKVFRLFQKKFGLDKEVPPLNTALFQRPGDQLGFDI